MQNTARYQISSVDNALRLVRFLQAGEILQVSTVARRLGVGRSTAHRLLSMLVLHGFAVQGPDREYLRGPALQDPQGSLPVGLSLAALRQVSLPGLRSLTDRAGETSNVQLLLGEHSRVVASVECDRPLRVSDREGQYLPAERSSGGQAILGLNTKMHEGITYAINDQLTEEGITAIGVPVQSEIVPASLAVSIAMPSVRFAPEALDQWVPALAEAAEAIADAISAHVR